MDFSNIAETLFEEFRDKDGEIIDRMPFCKIAPLKGHKDTAVKPAISCYTSGVYGAKRFTMWPTLADAERNTDSKLLEILAGFQHVGNNYEVVDTVTTLIGCHRLDLRLNDVAEILQILVRASELTQLCCSLSKQDQQTVLPLG